MRGLVWLVAAGLGWLLYSKARAATARVPGGADSPELAPLSPFAEQA